MLYLFFMVSPINLSAEALLGVLVIRDNSQNKFRDKG